MAEDGFPEVLNSLGLAGHSLVLFWKRKFDERSELTLDPKKYYIIGCDEEDATNLSRYRTHFAGSTINLDNGQKEGGVIGRVYMNDIPEMIPNISYYSEDEYPHRDFALTCGVRASFCFPFTKFFQYYGVMEIVSTCNQEVGVVSKLCECIEEKLDLYFYGLSYTVLKNEYAIPELDRLLEEVCQKFHLPLTQYYYYGYFVQTLVHQFSYRDYENLAPWCHFKDACFHMPFGYPLGNDSVIHEAFFCKDITALSITQYPFVHYARNCGSIASFTIFLYIISPEETDAEDEEIDAETDAEDEETDAETDAEDEETDEEIYKEYVLEFFLPSQKMDKDYTQTLLNFIWATLKKCPLNFKLGSRKQLGQVLSVKIINPFTQTEPESFEIGQPQSSLPHHQGSGYTHTLNRSNSDSYQEPTTGETSKRILNEASQPRRSEQYFKTKGNTVAAERVEESTIEELAYATSKVDVGCVTSNVDIRNAMTTASQLSRFQTMKTLCQQEEETMFLETEGYTTSQQLPRISQPLYEDGTEQDEQVLEIKKTTPNIYSYEEMSIAATSKRTPEYIGQIISLDELDEELPIKRNEPQSLTSQPSRSEEIFGDEGYTVASERVDNLVEVSTEEDVATTASKRLKKSKIPCTAENIRKHFGRPLKDAAESFGVSVSTFKRRCRDVDISWWQPVKRKIIDGEPGEKPSSSGMPNTPVVTNASQDFTMMVKVAYNTDMIRFELNSSSGIAELENSVIERLPLKRKCFSLKYQDEEDDWILIACDKDVQECMKISRSLKKTTIKMLIGPPIDNYAP